MTRIRTHNNRRRSRELKQCGLYRWAYGDRPLASWAESGATPVQIFDDIRRMMNEPSCIPVTVEPGRFNSYPPGYFYTHKGQIT